MQDCWDKTIFYYFQGVINRDRLKIENSLRDVDISPLWRNPVGMFENFK